MILDKKNYIILLMKRKFAAFDIDGTFFRGGLFRELAFKFIEMGILDKNISQQILDKNSNWNSRSHEKAFTELDLFVSQEIDKFLKGMSAYQYDHAVREVIDANGSNVYVYTRELALELRKKGYFLIAISHSTQELVESFCKLYNFDISIGRKWERMNDRLTGVLLSGNKEKGAILDEIVTENNLDYRHSYAIGDTLGDISMLQKVEHPIAFNPNPSLFEVAEKNKWMIVIERKGMAYSFNGSEKYAYELKVTKKEVLV